MFHETDIKVGKEVFAILHNILHYEWDPININDVPECDDEYDHYIPELYQIICTTDSYTKIFDYLWYLETVHIGTTDPGNIKAYDSTVLLAKQLFALKDKIIKNNFISNYKVEFVDELSPETKTKIKDGCIEYERQRGIDVNYEKFSIAVTDEDNHKVIGVLNAYTVYAEIYVDNIWVDVRYRKRGYGRKMLQALYDHFDGEGFNNINLVTSEFQATEFYKKCGFIVEFIRKNKHNPEFTKTFFIKYFDDVEQKQGILENWP